jgi:hypothetical protein
MTRHALVARARRRAVCKAVIGEIDAGLAPAERKDVLKVEAAMQKYCDIATGKNKQMCYYMGIADKLSGSAGGVKREISGSLSRGINANRLCTRLKKMDQQMCELKYEKVIDLNTVDLAKLKVKDLRKVMDEKNIECVGCMEKADFIKAIHKFMGKKDEM